MKILVVDGDFADGLLVMLEDEGHDVRMAYHLSLLKNVDKAMYQAKASGKNSYQFCSHQR